MISQLGDALGPIVAMVMFFAIAYFALQFRHKGQALRHAERMAALEKGMEIPPDPPSSRVLGPKAYLLRGLIWLFVGMGISIFFITLRFSEHDNNLLAVATLGLIPIGVGVAHLAIYRLDVRDANSVKS
jgi:hypothetical protein